MTFKEGDGLHDAALGIRMAASRGGADEAGRRMREKRASRGREMLRRVSVSGLGEGRSSTGAVQVAQGG